MFSKKPSCIRAISIRQNPITADAGSALHGPGTGISLPAVELIKTKGTYIVRDDHHRISVASYMGAEFIDARVTELVLEA